MTSENSPSKVAAADQPFSHYFSTEAVTSAESLACAAPLTTKLAPDSISNLAAIERSERVQPRVFMEGTIVVDGISYR